MARPRYESRQDRENEAQIIQDFCGIYGYDVERQEDRRRVNYFCYRGEELKLIVEVKSRNNRRDHYPDVMFSKRKWDSGLRLSEKHGVPFMIIIRWTDFTGGISNRMAEPDRIGRGGRSDRGDPADKEQMVYFATSKFRQIGRRSA